VAVQPHAHAVIQMNTTGVIDSMYARSADYGAAHCVMVFGTHDKPNMLGGGGVVLQPVVGSKLNVPEFFFARGLSSYAPIFVLS
jgi:hypothetical protein